MLLAGFGVAVAALIRPEAPILGIAMVVALWVDHIRRRSVPRAWSSSWRLATALALGFAALYLPYLAWRILYFGHMVPNTVLCKAMYAGDPWQLLLESAPVLLVVFALALPGVRRWMRPENLVGIATAVLYCLVLYDVDPTVGYLSRHFMLAFALLLVPATCGLHSFFRRVRTGADSKLSLHLVLSLKTLLTAVLVVGGANERLASFAAKYAARAMSRRELADWLSQTLRPGQTYVQGDVGLTGYLTTCLHVSDAYCLNNSAMTRAPSSGSKQRFAKDVIRDKPEVVIVASKSPDQMVPRSSTFRYILSDPGFARLYQHVKTFAPARDEFNYWAYLRRDLMPSSNN